MSNPPPPRRLRLRLHLAASRIHKWLALVIGVQLLLWFASGVVMSFLPIGEVRGEHLVDRTMQAAIPAGTMMAPPEQIIAAAGEPVEAMTWRMLDGKPVAELTTAGGTRLLDARNGALLGPLDGETAVRIAAGAWKVGPPPHASVSRVTRESPEYRGQLPAWRVAFADPDATAAFVTVDTGRITAVRTGTWRLYDLFWALHIMDWKNHEDTNSPWLLAFALGGLALGLAGIVLLVLRWPLRRRPGKR